ncbi:hypothetical protein ACJX0J_039948, partial [Zea mays]
FGTLLYLTADNIVVQQLALVYYCFTANLQTPYIMEVWNDNGRCMREDKGAYRRFDMHGVIMLHEINVVQQLYLETKKMLPYNCIIIKNWISLCTALFHLSLIYHVFHVTLVTMNVESQGLAEMN